MICYLLFLASYRVRTVCKRLKRGIISIYDRIVSMFYPYVWRNLQLEYTPQHIMLTGGLLPSKAKERYLDNIAQILATSYDQGITQFTLHLPYALWSYGDIAQLSACMSRKFHSLDYRAFVSFVSHEADRLLAECDECEDGVLFGKNVTVLLLSPTASCSNLSVAQMVV